MKVVYVDPINPLPDRQYYGRVQLVEVRNENGMAFPFLPCGTFKKKKMHRQCMNKYQILDNVNERKFQYYRP